MAHVWCVILSLLLVTAVLADYYIDNANTSVLYAMAPANSSAQGWQVFSTSTEQLALSITNSTGNYTIPLDASNLYDQNYALGVCGTSDNCFVTVPFTGSGISMYVFNAGASGMEASFSVDGSPGVTNSIDAPPPPTFQVSNVSIYGIQGLPSGNHAMVMTVLDWNGKATSMKFDYAYVNETLVTSLSATPTSATLASASTSQSSTPTSTEKSSTSNETDIGITIGGTLGVLVLASLAFGIFYLRKRKVARQEPPPERIVGEDSFGPEYPRTSTPPFVSYISQRPSFSQHVLEERSSVSPFQRSAILRDALTDSSRSSDPAQYSQSMRSGLSSEPVLQPLRRPTSHTAEVGLDSPFVDHRSRQNLTTTQLDIIDRLRAYAAPEETIRRVMEGFAPSRAPVSEGDSCLVTRGGSVISSLPPPSYQTRAR